MKRIISLICIFAMLLSIYACAAETDTVDVSEYTNNEAFVMYTDGSFEVMTFDNTDALRSGIAQLLKRDDVELVQPNYTYTQTGLTTSDEYADRQWALSNDGSFYMEEEKNEHPVFDTPFGDMKMPWEWEEPDFFGIPGGFVRFDTKSGITSVVAKEGVDVGAVEAWSKYSASEREVVVAIVDTGIDYSHEDLKGKIRTNTDEVANNGIDDDKNGYIDDVYGWNFYNNSNRVYVGNEDDHGTHGAGTIAANADNGTGVAGIAQGEKIKVMPVKALGGRSGSGTTASIIRAIQYAEANGADICNLSLGTAYGDSALYKTIAESDMLFVAASGNDGVNTDVSPSYPASYNLDNIIAVANLSYDGNLHYSSNYGAKTVDIAAPGSYILSTTTDDGYSYMTGTSMSAPMVSAAAALVYSHFGDNIELSDVKDILLASAVKTDSLAGTSVSGGMLNIASALSFDLEKLPGIKAETVRDKGSAPTLKAFMATVNGEQYLAVSVNDTEGDVVTVKYAEGEKSKEFFTTGGEELELSSDGTVAVAAKAGTFTFYAVDSMGNATATAFTVTEREESTRDRRTPHRGNPFEDMPSHHFHDMPPIPDFFREIVSEYFPEITPWLDNW